ncbi:MAG: hypothetical protein LH478_03990 [Chitinophagaceae bacterium]|nr:hypothetical protein [Chitinophagaceae bacterium]
MKFPALLKVLSISTVMLWAGCAEKKAKQREFYYYPDMNLYFDVAKNNFIYSLDGGQIWDTIDGRSNNIPTSLGDKIFISYNNDSVWKDNKIHREKYGGYIYNVIDDDSTDTAGATMVTEKEIVKKKPVTDKKAEEKIKERKGLGKLLNKIFGKKKDKETKSE